MNTINIQQGSKVGKLSVLITALGANKPVYKYRSVTGVVFMYQPVNISGSSFKSVTKASVATPSSGICFG